MTVNKVILSALLLLYSCSEEKKPAPQTDIEQPIQTASFNPPTDINPDFLKELFEVQLAIMRNPQERQLREKFIYNAYLSDRNTLITLGAGRLQEPDDGAPISMILVKRAARLDAQRWATYGLLWINNDFKPPFGKINELNSGESRELYTFNYGDSLVIAIASRVR